MNVSGGFNYSYLQVGMVGGYPQEGTSLTGEMAGALILTQMLHVTFGGFSK